MPLPPPQPIAPISMWRDIGRFIGEVFHFWGTLLSGISPIILLWIWSKITTALGYPEMSAALPDPLMWALVTLAVFIASFRAWRSRHQEVGRLAEIIRAKLKCSFSASDPGCVKRNIKIGESNGKEVKGTFYRVKVETDGVTQVNSCCGRLRSIKHNGTEVFSGQPCRLPFTPSERPDSVDKTIYESEPEYLDCVLITNGNKVFIWASDQEGQRGPKYGNLLEVHGDYEFNISVVSSTSTCLVPPLILKWRGSQQSADMLCHAVNI